MTIIEKLKTIFSPGEYFDPYELEIKNWPDIEFDGDMERLDMENWEVTELTDNHMRMKCGGDWQEPYEVRIILNTDNDFEVISWDTTEFGLGDEINMDKLLGLE
jgi:hypothetical protein